MNHTASSEARNAELGPAKIFRFPVAKREGEIAPAAFTGSGRRVLFVTPEMSDFVQAGGLGSVSASLPRALRDHCDLRVLLPGYRQVLTNAQDLSIVAELPAEAGLPACRVALTTTQDGLRIFVLLCDELFDREGGPYADASGEEYSDNDVRFARLSLAAAEIASRGIGGWTPDCLHLNDWPTALTAGYLAWRGIATPSLLTIHNLAHQGLFEPARMEALAIPNSAFTIDGVEFHGKISFLKAGLNHASHLTTVSAAYAEQVTTREHGCGLDGLLHQRAMRGELTGILNGIEDTWDPRLDERCPYLFDVPHWKGRYADYIRGAFRLSLSRAPLFAMISRLVHQKGVDLVLEASETIVALGAQLIVIGHGEPRYEREFAALAAHRPDAVAVRSGYDPEVARAFFAASDFLLMPSRFEPCGLSQMYAMRFGSLPVVHRTGGLGETVKDGKTGFVFDAPTRDGLTAAVRRAAAAYADSSKLAAMRREAMSTRFTWRASARSYASLYRNLAAQTVQAERSRA